MDDGYATKAVGCGCPSINLNKPYAGGGSGHLNVS